MSITSILVHLADNDDQLEKRLAVARRLASRFDAHIHAVFIATPQVNRGIGRSASSSFMNDLEKVAIEKAEKVRALFERECEAESIPHAFSIEKGDDYHILAAHARAGDLLIVSQPQTKNFEDRFRHLLPEELVIISGLPVLMIPRDWEEQEFGHHIMVAWRWTRESVRAVRDSMDFLKKADKVTVLHIDNPIEDNEPCDQVEAYLKRHNLNIEMEIEYDDEVDTDKASILQSKAIEFGADSITMGAYSHKKWFRRIIGTTTQSMIRHSKIPLILSH